MVTQSRGDALAMQLSWSTSCGLMFVYLRASRMYEMMKSGYVPLA